MEISKAKRKIAAAGVLAILIALMIGGGVHLGKPTVRQAPLSTNQMRHIDQAQQRSTPPPSMARPATSEPAPPQPYPAGAAYAPEVMPNAVYVSGRHGGYGRLDPQHMRENLTLALSHYLTSQLQRGGFPDTAKVEIVEHSRMPDGSLVIWYRQRLNDIPLEYLPSITVAQSGEVLQDKNFIFAESRAEDFIVTPDEARSLAATAFADRSGVAVEELLWSNGTVLGVSYDYRGRVEASYLLRSGLPDVGVVAQPNYDVVFYVSLPQRVAGSARVSVNAVTGETALEETGVLYLDATDD